MQTVDYSHTPNTTALRIRDNDIRQEADKRLDMIYFWQRMLLPVFLLVITTVCLWIAFGALVAIIFFALFLFVYLVFHLYQLMQLEKWLNDPENRAIPTGRGLWEEVFAQITKMIRNNRKDREHRMAALKHLEQATAALPEGVIILGEADHIVW